MAEVPSDDPVGSSGAESLGRKCTRFGVASVALGLYVAVAGALLVLAIRASAASLAKIPAFLQLLVGVLMLLPSPLLLVGGIACGHRALAEVRSGRRAGRRWALAGLGLGYGILAAAAFGMLFGLVSYLASFSGFAS